MALMALLWDVGWEWEAVGLRTPSIGYGVGI